MAAVERDRLEHDVGFLGHRDDQAFGVAAPDDGGRVVVAEVEDSRFLGAAVLQLQLPLVGLVAVAHLRGPGEPSAVGRDARLRVVAVVVGGQVLRR